LETTTQRPARDRPETSQTFCILSTYVLPFPSLFPTLFPTLFNPVPVRIGRSLYGHKIHKMSEFFDVMDIDSNGMVSRDEFHQW